MQPLELSLPLGGGFKKTPNQLIIVAFNMARSEDKTILYCRCRSFLFQVVLYFLAMTIVFPR